MIDGEIYRGFNENNFNIYLSRSRRMKQVITVRIAALLMLFLSLPLAAKVSGLPDFTELVEKTGPAVVNIRVTQTA